MKVTFKVSILTSVIGFFAAIVSAVIGGSFGHYTACKYNETMERTFDELKRAYPLDSVSNFGAWDEIKPNTLHEAEEDGFVVANLTNNNSKSRVLEIKTGREKKDRKLKGTLFGKADNAIVPISQGEHYIISVSNTASKDVSKKFPIHWVPLNTFPRSQDHETENQTSNSFSMLSCFGLQEIFR